MAVLTPVAPAVAFTPAAATGGGDTAAGGPGAGGWDTAYLLVVVGSTGTVITVDGVATATITSQSVLIPLRRYNGAPVTVTYSQVTGVSVAVIKPANAYTAFGN
jgi:hypothetical protein